MDQELVAYLEQRFATIDQRFTEVRTDIADSAAGVKAELRAEIAASAAGVKDELRAEIAAGAAGVKDELRAEIAAGAAGVKDELRADIAASAAGLRRELSAEVKRHIDVVVEDMISRMELIVEGVRTVDRRLDRLGDEVREEFRKVDLRLLRLHAARVSDRPRRRPGC
jgi:hypothetical protein